MYKWLLSTLLLVWFLFFPKIAFAYYTNMPASVVVGQTDFTSSSANQGGGTPTASTLNNPIIPFSDGTHLFEADASNNRVLIWNHIPSQNGTPADLVLGQPDFISNTANNGGACSGMSAPVSVFYDGNHLIVSDQSNSRVLIWNSLPTQNNQPADVIVGHSSCSDTSSPARSQTSLAAPLQAIVDNGKLFVSSTNHKRIMIWNSIPTTNGALADVVVGQPDFTSNNSGAAANTFITSTRGISVKNGKMVVGDAGRVLIWNTIPTTNGASADVVLGQNDFSGTGNDNGGISCSSVNGTDGIIITDNNRLILGQSQRILIFNSVPTTNNAPADIVLGQNGCTTRNANNGGLSANSLNGSQRIGSTGRQLFVSDSSNHRLLIFDNVLSGPQLSMNAPEQIINLKLKVSGSVQLGERGKYALQTMKANVNGQGFSNVTYLGGGTDDGSTQTRYEFYHEFEPWAGISAKDQYDPSKGYTLNLKASSFNAEEDNIFYFTPFSIKSIVGSIINLNINKDHWDRIKTNLDSYEIQQKKGTEWVTMADKITLDSELIKSTKTLSGEIRLVAKDKWGHRQSVTNSLKLGGFSSYNPNFKFATAGFPLQINSVSGFNTGIISTYQSITKNSFVGGNTKPTFSGIAYAGSTVTVLVTDPVIGRSAVFTTTTKPDSKWSITPTLYNTSVIDVWTTLGDKYTELPPFKLSVLRSEQ